MIQYIMIPINKAKGVNQALNRALLILQGRRRVPRQGYELQNRCFLLAHDLTGSGNQGHSPISHIQEEASIQLAQGQSVEDVRAMVATCHQSFRSLRLLALESSFSCKQSLKESFCV